MISLRGFPASARVVSLALALGALSASCGLLYDYSGYERGTGGQGGSTATSVGSTGGAGGAMVTSSSASASAGGAASSSASVGGASVGSASSTSSGRVAKSCADVPCGPLDDGCGHTLDCGLCSGTKCASNGECGSHHCIDEVCCDTGCTDLCLACTKAKKGWGQDGSCGVVLANLDPDSESVAVYRPRSKPGWGGAPRKELPRGGEASCLPV